jgi:hypothetical protein
MTVHDPVNALKNIDLFYRILKWYNYCEGIPFKFQLFLNAYV